MAQSGSPSPPLRSRTASGGAKRYLEQRRQQQHRHQLLQQRRKSADRQADQLSRSVAADYSAAWSDDASEESIRLFLQSLESAEAMERQMHRAHSVAAASERRASLDCWSQERIDYWLPPPDTRRELLATAENHLQASENATRSDGGFEDTDSEPESCYVPRSVIDFKSRAAWTPKARPRPGPKQQPIHERELESSTASRGDASSQVSHRQLNSPGEYLDQDLGASNGAPKNLPEQQPRDTNGALDACQTTGYSEQQSQGHSNENLPTDQSRNKEGPGAISTGSPEHQSRNTIGPRPTGSPEHQSRNTTGPRPTNNPEHKSRNTTGHRPKRHPEQQSRELTGARAYRPSGYPNPENQSRTYAGALAQPDSRSESSSNNSEAPRLDQLIQALRQAPAYSRAAGADEKSAGTSASNKRRSRSASMHRHDGSSSSVGESELDPSRRLFIVRRYHPAEVPNNLISAACSQFDDQMSETSV